MLFAYVAILAWSTLSAALFAMWGSFVSGVAAIALLVWRRPTPRTWGTLSLVIGPVVAAQLVLPEFAEELDEMACLARAAQGLDAACSVEPDDVGALYTSRQHLAVRWLNAHMAVGGWLLGFREVAYETAMLDLSSTRERRLEVQQESMKTRRRYCAEGAAEFGPTHTRESDFVLDAAVARAAAAKLARKTRDGQRRWEDLAWPGTYDDNPWHVVLALLVPGSRLHALRKGEDLQMKWAGGIQYPPHRIASKKLPRPLGKPYRLNLDEAVFCGLQMDGVFVPYRMEWTFEIARDDKRLDAPRDEPRPVESLLR